MPIDLSPLIERVIRGLSEIRGMKIAPRFKKRGGAFYVGDFSHVEIRLLEMIAKRGKSASVFLEKLEAAVPFRIAVGSPMPNYALLRPHRFTAPGVEMTFYSLPDDLYAAEFKAAFSGGISAESLGAISRYGWPIVLTSQQIEVIVPEEAIDAEVTACLGSVMKAATQSPYLLRKVHDDRSG
jgi:hypothetical protein